MLATASRIALIVKWTDFFFGFRIRTPSAVMPSTLSLVAGLPRLGLIEVLLEGLAMASRYSQIFRLQGFDRLCRGGG
jgi:hypothetical protein